MALAIPIPQVRPEVGAGREQYRAARSLASVKASQGRQLQVLGGQISALAAERTERQATFQLASAKADYEMASETWTDEFLSNEQMGERVKGGKDAFAAGDEDYAGFLKSTADGISKGLLPAAKDAFRLYTTHHGQVKRARFADTLSARQLEYNRDTAMKTVLKLTESGQLDVVTDYVATLSDLWAPEEMDEIFDMARSETLYNLMATDPDKAKELAQEIEWSTPGLQRRVIKAADDTEKAMEAQAEKDKEKALIRTGAESYADMAEYATTNGQSGQLIPIPVLSEQYANGAMTKAAYDACMAIWKDKPKPDRATRDRAYDTVDESYLRFKNGDISESVYEGVRLRNSPKMDETDSQFFISAGNRVISETVTRLRASTRSDATKVFGKPPGEYSTELIPRLEQLAMVGRVARRMNQWVDENIVPDKPIPIEKYERESLRVIGIVKDEYEAQKKAGTTSTKTEPTSGIPAGFDEIWPGLSNTQQEAISKLPPRQQKRFLSRYKKPLEPVLDIGTIPSSVFKQ